MPSWSKLRAPEVQTDRDQTLCDRNTRLFKTVIHFGSQVSLYLTEYVNLPLYLSFVCYILMKLDARRCLYTYIRMCKFPGVAVRDADHSPRSSTEVKNLWNYTSTPPIRLHGVVIN